MKLIYCIHSLYNPGGMERVLLNKVAWLTEHTDCEIVIVTTDQKQRPTFYPFPDGVKMVDLGVNYSDDNGKGFFAKLFGYIKRRQLHKHLFHRLLKGEKPDVVDCFYPGECSFVPALKDGSKKVMELHQSKLFHHQYNRSGLMGLADKIRAKMDERLVRKFDSFVVLTEEDAQMWGDVPNIKVIPNAAKFISDGYSNCEEKRVIAVGRLEYQKGFDRLIEAWGLVQKTDKYSDWHLDIFGQGEWHDMLQQMIEEKKIANTAHINAPTSQIGKEYAKSSMLVMSSHYEGFPMVMIEAMACGLPVVTFDYKCGPRDIIDHESNGLLVKDGDIAGLAEALMRLMDDEDLRQKMGENAKLVVERYAEDRVMGEWQKLYKKLLD